MTTADSTPTAEQLEREGDAAADFIEGLLDIADLDGDLELDVRQGALTSRSRATTSR